MKKDIHPKYYPEAKIICACGNVIVTGATKPEIRTDVCSACHPFFTGEQRIVDSAGQVERFRQRLMQKEQIEQQLQEETEMAAQKREDKKKSRRPKIKVSSATEEAVDKVTEPAAVEEEEAEVEEE